VQQMRGTSMMLQSFALLRNRSRAAVCGALTPYNACSFRRSRAAWEALNAASIMLSTLSRVCT
jgi:hypothetical protein